MIISFIIRDLKSLLKGVGDVFRAEIPCKMIYYEFSENVLTYFDIVKHIRISYNLNSLYYNIKADIAMKQIPDIA